jgi:L-Ala-D/L-Glu epimerase
MIITAIEVFKSKIKLKKPFVISLGTLYYAENIIVKIHTDTGIIGFGENSPFWTINGESYETGFIVAQYLSKTLIHQNPLDIASCIDMMDKVIYQNNSIKSAFDIALHDIASQKAGVPLYSFLGGQYNKTLITDYTVSLGSTVQMAEDAQWIVNQGYQVIKVKVGKGLEQDIMCIKAIREKIGNTIPIRIDANQAWDVQTAIAVLKALAPYNIQHCEEPIPRWDFMSLSKVKASSPITIMADESCCDHHDAKRLIDLNACSAFNIKLGKSGGLHKAQKIVQAAEQSQMKLQIGGFFESRLGFTASAHLALTSNCVLYCDFDTPLMCEEDPVENGISYHTGGKILLPNDIGLGAKFNQDYLNRMEKWEIKTDA